MNWFKLILLLVFVFVTNQDPVMCHVCASGNVKLTNFYIQDTHAGKAMNLTTETVDECPSEFDLLPCGGQCVELDLFKKYRTVEGIQKELEGAIYGCACDLIQVNSNESLFTLENNTIWFNGTESFNYSDYSPNWRLIQENVMLCGFKSNVWGYLGSLVIVSPFIFCLAHLCCFARDERRRMKREPRVESLLRREGRDQWV